MKTLNPFHLAIPVNDLAAARVFYGEVLGCAPARSSSRWVDFNFMGHQLVCHLDKREGGNHRIHNDVDNDRVPVPHFGVVLDMPAWTELSQRLLSKGTEFVIPPRTRFNGKAGEQATFFIKDPSGNALEFKAFADPGQLFARDEG